MSSTFKDKLAFEKESYLTPKLISSKDLVFQSINSLELNKNKKGDKLSNISHLVHSRGFEPLTLGAEIRYSIQLNYECDLAANIKSILVQPISFCSDY